MRNNYFQKTGVFLLLCFLLAFDGLAQVGIGVADAKTGLDVNGALSLREGNVLNLGNGDVNDIDLGTTPYSFYRITGDNTDFNITGIKPAPNVNGQMLVLLNMRNAVMTIKNNSNSSVATNRIYVPAEKDLHLRGQYTTITLRYSNSLNRWILLDKLNHIETWKDRKNIGENKTVLFSTTIPQVTKESSVTVNFSNIPSNLKNHLFIEYVEARDGQVDYRIRTTRWSLGWGSLDFDIIITVNKI